MALTKSLLKACYLLTPDPELQAVGSETKIPYEEDYNFYLECLLKLLCLARVGTNVDSRLV